MLGSDVLVIKVFDVFTLVTLTFELWDDIENKLEELISKLLEY